MSSKAPPSDGAGQQTTQPPTTAQPQSTTTQPQSTTTQPPSTTTQPTQPTPSYKYPYHGRRVVSATNNQIYHEKQTLQHCAVHTINNIIQYPAYTDVIFDTISKNFAPDSWINPHKAFYGGNYDANVLLYALNSETGLDTTWYNRKKHNLVKLDTSKLAGVIVNVITSSFLWWEQRHWIPLVPMLTGNNDQINEYNHAMEEIDAKTMIDGQQSEEEKNEKMKMKLEMMKDLPQLHDLWFNLNPLSNGATRITNMGTYLDTLVKKDKEAIVIFVMLPGVDASDIWLTE